MIPFRNSRSILLTLFTSFAVVSCSDDDDKVLGPPGGTPDPGAGKGNASITISGDLDYELDGFAEFEYMDVGSTDPGSPQYWDMRIFDSSPLTFELKVNQSVGELNSTGLTPGTYEVRPGNNEKDIFFAMFKDIDEESPMFSPLYSVLFEEPGTLIIVSSSEDTVTGTIGFVGHEIDNSMGIISTINVSASFTAKQK